MIALLIFVAYLLYADRKIWAAVQLRRGPERRRPVGPAAVLRRSPEVRAQGAGRSRRGANKASSCSRRSSRSVLALSAWAVIPLAAGWVIADINVGILYIFAISSLGVYGIIMGGWASNSKYAFLGALRSAAQMVSYEVSIGFVIITVLLCVGSLNLTDIVIAQTDGLGTMLGLPNTLPRLALAAALPDVRHLLHLGARRDQPAALRPAGSGIGARRRLHGRIFLDAVPAVHARRVRRRSSLMCALTTILFLGGWLPPFDVAPFTWVPGVVWFVLKVCFVFFMFAMVKAIVPRYRYDQLMRLGWKVFLPLSLFMVVARRRRSCRSTGWGG